MNILKGTPGRKGNQTSVVLSDGVDVLLSGRDIDLPDGAPITLGVRPEHIEVRDGLFEVAVNSTEILGSETIIHAETKAGDPFTIAQRGISGAKPGDLIPVNLPEPCVHLFDATGLTVGASSDWRSAYLS